MRHYWLVALFALAAFVLLVLIFYTWPQPPLPEADAALRSECVGRSLQVRFEAEGRDPTWASATERTIVAGLAGLSTVTKVTTLSVDCRQSVRNRCAAAARCLQP